eukprot:Gregarina_sp_Pseudo_9__1778@NODE_2209_length_1095_cov_15_684659_g2034_i0_p1_GENE_NODE_2209_length_1095_cov_15_684659_g2034_i0NODE_2209_length_1095_cov_15_684659_g2034_i0_p1_ORF_typecomplete_len322_score81_99TFIIA/PF03153_13/9_8e10_NODE_2209_length_1095_cov_15_684659_g2034_i0811046
MASQTMDDVMGVYMTVIEDTIQRCRNVQNSAVLDQVRERWIANLNNRIRQSLSLGVDARNVRNAGNARAVLKPNPAFDKVKIKVKADPDDQPVPQRQSLAEVFAQEKASRLQPRPQLATASAAESLWSNAATEGSVETRSLPTVGTERGDGDGGEGAAEDDEDWGDWEDPEEKTEETASPSSRQSTAVAEVTKAEQEQPAVEQPPTEGYVDAQGNYIPTEADFATRVTTAYGRGNPMLNGSNALHWDKPDEIDSDLDNVSDLEDDEPIARDSIIGQFEAVAKPAGRKATSSGLWKIKVKNGIAKINGQEFFFDTLCADLEF